MHRIHGSVSVQTPSNLQFSLNYNHGLLETATLSVAQMAAYNKFGGEKFRVQSYKNYGRAIRMLQTIIESEDQATDDKVITSILLLCVLKDISGEKHGGTSDHAPGLFYLVEKRGPEQIATSRGAELLFLALIRLQVYSFLQEDDTYVDPGAIATIWGVFDPLLRALSMMSRTLSLRHRLLSGQTNLNPEEKASIIQTCSETLDDFHRWDVEAADYWQSMFKGRGTPTALGEVASGTTHYDVETACTIILIRSARLILLMSMIAHHYLQDEHNSVGTALAEYIIPFLEMDVVVVIDDILACVPYALGDVGPGGLPSTVAHDGAAAIVIAHRIMGIASRLFSLPSLTIAGLVEYFLVLKLWPDYLSAHSRFTAIIGTILVNYAFGIIFWAFLYPKLFSPLRRLPGPRVFVAKPQLLPDLLSHKCYDFAKPRRIAAFLRLIIGDGLITLEEDKHKFLRKNTLPAFHARHLTGLYPMMWSKAGILMRKLTSEIANGATIESKGSAVLELTTWASKVTLDIIGIAGMGREINAVEKASDPLQQLYEELLEPNREKIVYATLNLGFGNPVIKLLPWKLNQLFVYLTTSLDNICRDLIREKRIAIVQKEDDHFDILSLLIKSSNFDDEVLKDQLLTFLAAGHETTASALTWSAYLLAKHPDIQKKLRSEVTQALGEDPQARDPPEVDLANILKQMPYLNGIMHETLRLYPTVPVTMREALRDTSVGEQFIPKGTEMVVSIWQINRSPEIWGPDAGEFKPERWINVDDGKSNNHGGAKSAYDFLTFLQGPRSCIGQEFAKAEMRCLLASLVTSFDWDLAMDESKIVPRGVITIKPEHGMYLRMRPLHGKA
ncbi:hypothetical protein N0V88_001480 [Collariella sp. IMI 366227]|nr:hypothetical protein N0V88_001480 [Collariella sp. IMI 366227]